MFGNLKDKIKDAHEEMKVKLEQVTQTGSAADGKVKVEVNGNRKVLTVLLDPQVYRDSKPEEMEDLVREAANNALKKAELHAEDEMVNMAKGMLPPGLL